MSKIIHELDGEIFSVKLEGQFVGGDETDTLEELIKGDFPNDVKSLELDLENTTYMNSMVLGLLIGANSHLKRKGITLRIVNVPENILELFKLTKLDRLLVLS